MPHDHHLAEPLLRDVEAAEILACSRATLWRRVADGTVPPPIKFGGASRWPLSEILAVVEKAKAVRDLLRL
jgi:predicted DNA-binding transcriptional regulator AlpA